MQAQGWTPLKMHFYCLIRGNKPILERWQNDLLARYYPYEAEKGRFGAFQLGVREIKLMELAFPAKWKEEILTTIQPNLFHKEHEKYMILLRKLLNAKKIDFEIPKPKPQHFLVREGVEVAPIGIREDVIVDGIERI